MNSKFIGGILLIVGTSIGGGMLALPVANASTGFWASSVYLLIIWSLMTLGALYVLETNLYLPCGKHIVSMAAATLGTPGLLVAWISYIFLLYTLLSGYISGGADVLGGLTASAGLHLTEWQTSTIFTIGFGAIVYMGIYQVDLLNRGLMFGKLLIYMLLICLIFPHIQLSNLDFGNYRYITSTVMLLVTSFGFAIIVPNLRDYFNDDIKVLRKVVLIGSLIPLFCYLAWDAVIIGSLPTLGDDGLAALIHSEHATSSLSLLLSAKIDNKIITSFFNVFTSICMLTAFLGVALCLISFLADGLKLNQSGKEGGILFVLTFLPPLLIVIYYPGAYIYALNFAGIFCVILLLLLPALMSWFGRKKFPALRYKVPGGRVTQGLVIISSVLLLFNSINSLFN